LAKEQSQLEELKQELKNKNQLLTREWRQLEEKEKLVARRTRLDRNMQLYAEQYTALDPSLNNDSCKPDPVRKDKLAGARSLLKIIEADARALSDSHILLFATAESARRWTPLHLCASSRNR
jgi:hypothetical protein